MTDFWLGLATLPALALIALTVWEAFTFFTDRSTSHGCGTCDRWWGPRYDGSRSWVSAVRRNWHMDTSHPGYRGRALVRVWRDVDFAHWRRLDRMFPNPPITVWDVIARIPIIQSIAFAIAARHGRKKR